MPMPHKGLYAMFNDLQNLLEGQQWLGGVVMAVMMSALRLVYDRKETAATRILLESLICGALTLTIGSGLEAMGYGTGWYLFCGGMVGGLGSQTIRAFALKLLSRGVDKQ